jgi:hypothetical protein
MWCCIALLVLGTIPFAPSIVAGLPLCPLKTFTGLPCPSCGTMTAALALARLDVAGAIAASPLAACAWIGLVVGGLVAGVAALAGHGVPELPRELPLPARAAIVGVIAANWAYVIAAR